MPIFTVDSTGVRAPSLEEALADVRQQMADIFGDDLANADQTPQGQLAGIIATLETLIGEMLVNLGAATDPDNAVGTQLDHLYSLLDILRQIATRSRVTATVTGEAGTGLPAGSRAKTADGAEFRTIAVAVLAPSPGIMVEMEAVDEGPVAAFAGTLTQIVTVVPGWETCTNAEAAVLGVARQDDPTYRAAGRIRTAHRAVGTIGAMRAGLSEALATKSLPVENRTDTQEINQDWAINAHHIMVIAEGGTNGDIRRAVENYRGMGVGTMVGIVGGTPDTSTLNGISNGTVEFGGATYTGLDLTSTTTEQKAAALTALIAGSGVTVRAVDGVFIAMFGWHPSRSPMFGTGSTEVAFGLAPAVSSYPLGPFARPRERALTVALTVARQTGFPGNGLDLIRAAVNAVVAGYGIGQQAWSNDFLQNVEAIGGTRVTAISVEYNSNDASGVDTPLDSAWSLPSREFDYSYFLVNFCYFWYN